MVDGAGEQGQEPLTMVYQGGCEREEQVWPSGPCILLSGPTAFGVVCQGGDTRV